MTNVTSSATDVHNTTILTVLNKEMEFFHLLMFYLYSLQHVTEY